ncbi:SEC-C domain-containing protein [Photobacterium sp. GJ3]|uniref:YchJ family metal-binding protein n=1 Tax=Photobacterium sp. GJ3 TaxID=2829502 RepID=UPI001B8B3E70|nr:YchJ family metal-binding protein [Photobacterium sp. GJ3]QUJ68409.1 SEC-C domain-containing protein [Photobacterium sp. GJ3]
MKDTTVCPCGSRKPLETCCAPVHLNPSAASHPEQLMRARYSAHVLGLVDFVVNTYHPSCEAGQYRDAIAESIHSEWLGLEVLGSSLASNTEGYVEFKAFYREQGEECCLHENSRFLRETVGNQLQWFYIDGEYPSPKADEKTGRNDPCPCGSGKKFKKCCL